MDKLGMTADDILFLLESGDELNEETFDQFFATSNSTRTFAFKIEPEGEYFLFDPPALPALIDSPSEPLPHIGNSSLSIDSQIINLEKRLAVSKNELSLLISMCDQLICYLKECKMIKDILKNSCVVARKNLSMHTQSITKDLEAFSQNVYKIVQTFEALLFRCPIDLALLKRIPLKQGIYKGTERMNTLFEVNGDRWQESYSLSLSLKEALSTDVKNLEESIYKFKSSEYKETTDQKDIKDQYDLLLKQLKEEELVLLDARTTIENVLQDHELHDAVSTENLLVVKKSSRLLSMAEVSGRYTETFLMNTADMLNSTVQTLQEQRADKETGKYSLFDQAAAAIKKVYIKQKNLADMLISKNEVTESIAKLDEYVKLLEEIHAFPVAYIAILCEISRRVEFEKNLKKSFEPVQKGLSFTLDEEKRRRASFLEELSRLLKPDILKEDIINGDFPDGSAVLFVTDANLPVSSNNISELEQVLERENDLVSSEDPIRDQIQRFLETIRQMKQRSAQISSFNLIPAKNPSASTREVFRGHDRTPSKSENGSAQLIKSYEERIKNLERLLQQGYAISRNAESLEKQQQHGNAAYADNFEDQVLRLSENLANFDRAGVNDWQAGVLSVLSDCGCTGPVKDLDEAKGIIKSMHEKGLRWEQDGIVYSNFRAGDKVLFLPTIRSGVWSIFNTNQPNYYLHPDSLSSLFGHGGEGKEWALGFVESIEQMTSRGKTTNPYRLPSGFQYYEVRAISIQKCNTIYEPPS